MDLEFVAYNGAEEFLCNVEPFLIEREVENCLILGLSGTLASGGDLPPINRSNSRVRSVYGGQVNRGGWLKRWDDDCLRHFRLSIGTAIVKYDRARPPLAIQQRSTLIVATPSPESAQSKTAVGCSSHLRATHRSLTGPGMSHTVSRQGTLEMLLLKFTPISM